MGHLISGPETPYMWTWDTLYLDKRHLICGHGIWETLYLDVLYKYNLLSISYAIYSFHKFYILNTSYTLNCTVYDVQYMMCNRVYQNLAISSENYRTFPKVGRHYKEKACKFLARSDYSLRPNSCVLFEIFVAWRKISTAQQYGYVNSARNFFKIVF